MKHRRIAPAIFVTILIVLPFLPWVRGDALADSIRVPSSPRLETSSAGSRTPPAMGAFAASLFKFKTTLPDDGTDKGGGEQQASATLAFVDSRHDPPPAWICNVTIRMPLRTAKHGKIPAAKASDIAADVTTRASGAVMKARATWQATLFCKAFQDKMNDLFFFDYQGLGGRATANR